MNTDKKTFSHLRSSASIRGSSSYELSETEKRGSSGWAAADPGDWLAYSVPLAQSLDPGDFTGCRHGRQRQPGQIAKNTTKTIIAEVLQAACTTRAIVGFQRGKWAVF